MLMIDLSIGAFVFLLMLFCGLDAQTRAHNLLRVDVAQGYIVG
jgi:hypothetical protein